MINTLGEGNIDKYKIINKGIEDVEVKEENYSVANIYSKPSSSSDVSSQILYGEKFKILSNCNLKMNN